MFYNHRRQRVQEWDGRSGSSCPLCRASLVARRGDLVAWHWAHHPYDHARSGCDYAESDWHLQWKSVYLQLGWQIELPVKIHGQRFLLDAVNPKTGRIREFVHSFSANYAPKHRLLAQAGYDICWIFDGATACSLRLRGIKNAGISHFLKPLALDYARGLTTLVHTHPGSPLKTPNLWREWKENVWFPLDGERSRKVLELFTVEAMQPSQRDQEIEAHCSELYTRLDMVLLDPKGVYA